MIVFVCELLWIWGWLCTYAGGVEDAHRHGWGKLFCESDDDDYDDVVHHRMKLTRENLNLANIEFLCA